MSDYLEQAKEYAKIFAKEFLGTIARGNAQASTGRKWEISWTPRNRRGSDVVFCTSLALCDTAGAEFARIDYNVSRVRFHYAAEVTFSFWDDEYTLNETDGEFAAIHEVMEGCGEHFYERLCDYLHHYTMETADTCETEVLGEAPPVYGFYCTPHKMREFREKYGISPYVDMYVEILDEKGGSVARLPIKALHYNDESNELVLSCIQKG